jgi:hypothetical protein
MELVTVKIKGSVITSRYGALSTGDLLRTDAAFAKHLVEDCAAADYVNQPDTAPATPAAPEPKRTRKPKEAQA